MYSKKDSIIKFNITINLILTKYYLKWHTSIVIDPQAIHLVVIKLKINLNQ